MSRNLLRIVPVCLLAIAASACSGGNGDSTLTPASQNSKNATDTSFINGAAMSSNSEIGDANLALTRSTNPDVLSFANLMIKDHTTENDALDPIGTSLGQPPPTTIGPMMQAVSASLMPLSGAQFDAAYINSEITGHENNLNGNYVPELQTGLNVKVTGYAGTYQPQIQSHLSLAQSIKAKYGF